MDQLPEPPYLERKDHSMTPEQITQLVSTAVDYYRRGWTPIPEIDLRPEHEIRKPLIRDFFLHRWANEDAVRKAFSKTYSIRDGDKNFICDSPPNGIGILLGRPWAGCLVDVDLDNPHAVELAPMILPPTAIFGREGNPGSHWIYQITEMTDEDEQYVHYKNPVGIELRSGAKSQQKTTFPGSINKGELVRWENQNDIREISMSGLRANFDYLAGATLICHLWNSGERADLCSAICGAIARSIWDDVHSGTKDDEWAARTIQYWDSIIRRIAEIRGDNGISSRQTPVKAYQALAESKRMEENNETGPQVKGVRSLYQILDKEDARNLVKWLGLKEAAPSRGRPPGSNGGGNEPDANATERLHDFNADHAMMMVGGKAKVATFDEDGEYSLLGVTDATHYFASLPPIFVEIGDRVRALPFFKFWLQWEGRRNITDIVFDPIRKDHPGTTLNTWKGWAIAPKAGDCQLYLDHIRKVIANGDKELYEWIITWMADMVQNPTTRTGTSFVMRGEQGVGKGAVVAPLLRIFGKAALHLHDASRISGRFNSQLADKLLVYADEAWYAGDKQHTGILKAIVTEAVINIERKGMETEERPNYLRLIMSTNNEWAAPVGGFERRFAVIDVPSTHRQDREYFSALHKQMLLGGDAALLSYLLGFNLRITKNSGIIAGAIPKTRAGAENAVMSADPSTRWIYEYAMNEEVVVGSFNGESHAEPPLMVESQVRPAVLYNNYYLPWCRGRNLRPDSHVAFSKRLTKYGFKRSGNSITQVVIFPEIEPLRACFAKEFGYRTEGEGFDGAAEYELEPAVPSKSPYDDDEIPF